MTGQEPTDEQTMSARARSAGGPHLVPALTPARPTRYQIKRADADNDGQLECASPGGAGVRASAFGPDPALAAPASPRSEEEWLSFSQMLARLPRDMFFKTLDTYIAKVRRDRG